MKYIVLRTVVTTSLEETIVEANFPAEAKHKAEQNAFDRQVWVKESVTVEAHEKAEDA